MGATCVSPLLTASIRPLIQRRKLRELRIMSSNPTLSPPPHFEVTFSGPFHQWTKLVFRQEGIELDALETEVHGIEHVAKHLLEELHFGFGCCDGAMDEDGVDKVEIMAEFCQAFNAHPREVFATIKDLKEDCREAMN
jgi:hypothetical protein